MKCPRCGSEHLQYATNTYGGGGSVSKSCCGYMILGGPLGILCGLCNSGVKTEEFWVCLDCGNRFSNLEANISHGIEKLDEEGKTRREEERIELEKKEAEAKDTYLRYKDDISKHPDSTKTLNRIRAEYNLAQERKYQAKENIDNYVRQLKNHKNQQIRKAARNSSPSFRANVLAFVFLIVCALMIACVFWMPSDGQKLIVLFVGLLLLPLLAWFGLSVTKNIREDAKKELRELDKMYRALTEEYEDASRLEDNLRNLLEKYQYIEDYERKRYGKHAEPTRKKGKYEK